MDFHVAGCLFGFRKCEYSVAGRRTAFGEITPFKLVYIHGSDARLYIFHVLESQDAEWCLHNVATHIAERTGAIIPPATPVERHQFVDVVFLGSRTQPKVPIKFFGYLGRLCRPLDALRPHRPVSPRIDGMYIADKPRIKPFAHDADTVARCSLITHLGHYFI